LGERVGSKKTRPPTSRKKKKVRPGWLLKRKERNGSVGDWEGGDTGMAPRGESYRAEAELGGESVTPIGQIEKGFETGPGDWEATQSIEVGT